MLVHTYSTAFLCTLWCQMGRYKITVLACLKLVCGTVQVRQWCGTAQVCCDEGGGGQTSSVNPCGGVSLNNWVSNKWKAGGLQWLLN